MKQMMTIRWLGGRNGKRRIWYVAQAGMVLGLWLSPASAQVRLEMGKQPVDWTRYQYPEECLAASYRVNDSITTRSGFLRDTAPERAGEALTPLPSQVTETAKRCAASFAPQRVLRNDWYTMFELYLWAGQDSDASFLVQQRLGATENTAAPERLSVLDSIARQYRNGRPIRFSEARTYLRRIDSLPEAGIPARIRAYAQRMDIARQIDDTLDAMLAAKQIERTIDALTPEMRSTPMYDTVSKSIGTVVAAGLHIRRKELLAALGRTTDEYVQMREKYVQSVQGRNTTPPAVIGRPAPRLNGHFWFVSGNSQASPIPAGDTRMLKPASGKISLLVFLQTDCRTSGPWTRGSGMQNCFGAYAVLRRLGQRFPDLDITISTQTHGFFGFMQPPSPQEEAKMYAKWWLEYHRIPATLAVETTEFWHLSDPDGRRVNEQVRALADYSFDQEINPSRSVFLIDPQGTVVYFGGLGRSNERDIQELIDAMRNRTAPSRAAAAPSMP